MRDEVGLLFGCPDGHLCVQLWSIYSEKRRKIAGYVLAAALVFLGLVPVSLLAGFIFALLLRRRLSLSLFLYLLLALLLSLVFWLPSVWLADALMDRDCGPLDGKPAHFQWCYWYAAP